MNQEVLSRIRALLDGRCAVVGIGNVLRGDDGFGPALVEALPERPNRLKVVAGTTPENYVGKIVVYRPEAVLLVDAVNLGQEPGACELLPADALGPGGLSTHDIPLSLAVQYIEEGTGAQVAVLAIQPGDTAFGQPLSPPVQRALEEFSASLG